MCGITGFITPDRQLVDQWFDDAVQAARHRGPDQAATWLPGDAGPRSVAATRSDAQAASAALGSFDSPSST